MNIHKTLSIFLIELCLALSLFGSGLQPAFRHFTVDDGLPSSETYFTLQDSKGYLWIATDRGVARFDGYEMEIFTTEDGLAGNTVFSMTEDHLGRVWFLTYSKKVSYFKDGEFHAFPFNDFLSQFKLGISITSFHVDRSGGYHIGMAREGYLRLDSTGKTTHFTHPEMPSSSIFTDIEGDLFYYSNYHSVNTRSSLIQQHGDSIFRNLNTSILAHEFKGTQLHNGNKIFWTIEDLVTIFADSVHYMKVGTHTLDVFEDKNGGIWIGKLVDGVEYYPDGNYREGTALNFLNGKSISSINQDSSGGFWLTTLSDGVYYFPMLSINTLLLPDHSNKTTALSGNGKGQILAGYHEGTLVEFNREMNIRSSFDIVKYKVADIQYRPTIFEIQYNQIDDYMVISTGFNSVILRNRAIETSDIRKFSELLPLEKGRFVIARKSSGLVFYEEKPEGLKSRLVRNIKTSCIHSLDTNKFIVGTLTGAYLIENYENKGLWINSPLLMDRIDQIEQTEGGRMYFGTRGNGVIVKDDAGIWKINSDSGLTQNIVSALFAVGEDTLWVGTNGGVNRVVFKDQRISRIDQFTQSLGLPSNEISDIWVEKGRVWVATSKGIGIFNANLQPTVNTQTQTYLTGLTIDGKKLEHIHSFKINPLKTNLEVEFKGIDLRNAHNLRYKYRLIRDDILPAEAITQQRSLQFNTLLPGKYVFEVRAQNGDGSWSSMVASLSFEIVPYFYQTWWFKLLGIFFLLLILAIFYFVREKRLRSELEQKQEIDLQLANLELRALQTQMNPHFIFNTLNSISYSVSNKGIKDTKQHLTKFATLIRFILENSDTPAVLIEDDLKFLTIFIELEKMRFREQFEYTIEVDPEIDLSLDKIPPLLIQPFVENAIWHGLQPRDSKGFISIKMLKKDHLLNCIIEDNGVGRNFEQQPQQASIPKSRSMGMAITQERLTLLNKFYPISPPVQITDLTDEAGNPTGTRVEVFIPIL